MPQYNLFTDGSGSPTTRRGGWAFVLKQPCGCQLIGCGHEPRLATNRMELLAVIKGLEKLPKEHPCHITVYTDSLFVIMGRFARIKRHQQIHELWLELRRFTSFHYVDFVKVISKNEYPEHKRAHDLAREAVFNSLTLE